MLIVINDWNPNPVDLAQFKVVILPNAACLDDAQVVAIEQFVAAGGGLVASLDTSLFDEFGNARANLALAHVLGILREGLIEESVTPRAIDENFATSIRADYWEKRKSVFDFKQETGSVLNWGKMPVYVGASSVTFKGLAVQVAVKSPTAKVVGTLRVKLGAASVEVPRVVALTYGKG